MIKKTDYIYYMRHVIVNTKINNNLTGLKFAYNSCNLFLILVLISELLV